MEREDQEIFGDGTGQEPRRVERRIILRRRRFFFRKGFNEKFFLGTTIYLPIRNFGEVR